MIKNLITTLLILSSCFNTSCDYKKNSTTLKSSIDSMTYSAYRWRINKDIAGWELFIVHYISINIDGKYLAMRHNSTVEPAQYFEGSISNSLLGLIDSILSKKFDSTYFNSRPEIYDGNVCDLTFIRNEQQKHILFIQGGGPLSLQEISGKLDSVILKSSIQTNPFNFEGYKITLEKRSLATLGELPKLQQPSIKIK